MEKLLQHENKFDWIALDPPSTMTGLLRKVPDMKIRYNKKELSRKLELQKSMLSAANKFLKKGGKLVYSTSSLLEEENLLQAVQFCKEYKYDIYEGKHFQTFPDSDGMDGYFSVTLQKK